MVVALLIVLLLMFLASFLANDATASFDKQRLPPKRCGVKFRRGKPVGPSKNFWRVRPQGEPQRSRSRQKFLRAEPAT
jgi:hypothetical protein